MPVTQLSRMPRRYQAFRPVDRVCRKIKQRLARYHLRITAGWGYVVLLVILPLVFLVSLLVDRTHTNYHLLTGPKGSSRDTVGLLMADVLNQTTQLEQFLHVNIVPDYVPQTSCGSLDNLYYLNRGLAQLALVHDGLPLSAASAPGCPLPLLESHSKETHLEMRVRAVLPLFIAPLHIVARRELKARDLTDLRPNMRIYFGSVGGTSAYVAQRLLAQSGIDIVPQSAPLTYDQGVQQLLDGRLDVGFFLTGLNAQVLQRLMETGRFTLLSVGHASGLHTHFPYLHMVTIPGGTYEGVPRETVTVGATTILAASTALSEAEVYKVASTLSHHLHNIMRDVPMNVAKTIDAGASKDLYYPLHDGAIRFFDHNPPLMFDASILAGIGTYLSLLYAVYGASSQFLRKYRMQRVLQAVDRVVRFNGVAGRKPDLPRFQSHLRRTLRPVLQSLRNHRISYEDYLRITEYVKGHS